MKNCMKRIHVFVFTIIASSVFLSFVCLTEFPSDVIPFFAEWRITMGNGNTENDLVNYEHEDYFYDINDGGMDWVVYKSPNSGSTTPNSSNTRSELRQIEEWTPETGGRMTANLKVMNVSTTGDARVAAAYTVVIGQIHSNQGHKNEPLKLFYKKFPGHTKGSVFWNYEINTQGSNSGRWDYSTAVWGHDFSVVGSSPTDYPAEPVDGIELGEEFSYEVNVYNGEMHLTFKSEGHETQTFSQSLITSSFTTEADIPEQVTTLFGPIGQDGVERPEAYAGELQYFKQGSYNQANGKTPEDNIVWNTGAETHGGSLDTQYANRAHAEVWFNKGTVGPSIVPGVTSTDDNIDGQISIYPNPAQDLIYIEADGILNYKASLYDAVGNLMLQSTNQPTIDVNTIPEGIYLLQINDLDSNQTVTKSITIGR